MEISHASIEGFLPRTKAKAIFKQRQIEVKARLRKKARLKQRGNDISV